MEELAETGLVGEHLQGRVGFDDEEVVGAFGDFVLEEAVGFADAAFDEVSLNGIAAAAADGDGEGGGEVVITAEGVEGEGMGGAAFAGFEEFVDAQVAAEAERTREGVAGLGGMGWPWGDCSGLNH